MNKSVIAALVGLGIAAGADAATLGTPRTIYLTGATAFRGVEFDTLNNNIISDAANGITKEVVGTGSSAAYSFYGEWNGTGGPYVIRVYAAYSGSIEGQRDLLLGNLNTYSKLTQTDNLGVAGTFTHVATMSFSDSFQNTTAYGTAFGYPALNGNTVAVQPFVFVMNQAAYNAGIRNMTDQAFRLLATARREPSFFIGNGDFNSVVALSGRNDLSGTRTVTFAETGFGVFNKAQHWGNGVITGVYPTTTRGADNTVAPFTVALPFNDGWSSGGNVRADMNNSACTDAFVGYLSAGDARSLKGIDCQRSQAMDRVHVFNRDSPTDDEAKIEKDEGHRGQECVGYGVLATNHLVHQAFGTSCLDVVLSAFLDDGCAHDERVLSQVDDGQRRHRKNKMPRDIKPTSRGRGVHARVAETPSGEEPGDRADTDCENDQHDHAEPELWH